ncbi:dihydrodipicolinate reductase [bacterium]|nr:dihydrodipicolinate reductase [bacterium]
MEQIRVVQIGLGPIGIECAKLALKKRSLRLVGGVDIDPEKVGKDLGEILQLNRVLDLPVSNDIVSALEQKKPDLILHCTSSSLKSVTEQLNICIRAGSSVVSSCEELFHPYRRDAEWSKDLDSLAKAHGVTVTGTGVNPGFSLDILPLTLSSVCSDISKIETTRISDAGKRRLPLQKKVGTGLTSDEFRRLVDEGRLGHIGLVESLQSIADGFDWTLDNIDETIDPKIAENPVTTQFLSVAAGEVTGILHRVRGVKAGAECIKLELQMYVGAEQELDRVRIEGDPAIDLRIEGGIFGDTATVARMINAVPVVHNASPGLLTARALPVPCLIQ